MAAPAFAAGSTAGGGSCIGCLTGGRQVIEGVLYKGALAEVSFGLSPICCGEEPKPGTFLALNNPVGLRLTDKFGSEVITANGLLSPGNLQAHLGPLERVCDCS